MDKFPRHIKTHIFNGKEYSIEYVRIPHEFEGKGKKRQKVKVYGLCDNPIEDDALISIDTAQGTYNLLNTHIHEGAHATIFRLAESTIENLSDAISFYMWEDNYRLTSHRSGKPPKSLYKLIYDAIPMGTGRLKPTSKALLAKNISEFVWKLGYRVVKK